ncbi:MAG TPA: 16S rRNA (guanine(527)-N(7))-methyltransferase RsmG [Candidatus Saccharimonadia bacterium]|nr:16S rRNA (guanine(527)-N(7))-methyltransferase RsmG [Candidatus Saccharimonadia bacterium]
MSDLRASLLDGIDALGLALDEAACARLIDYLALLQRWNAAYNLTAIRDPRESVTKHLLDSLAVLPHLDAQPLADLGSGAGLPGIPIAIAQRERAVVLVESNGKKARFLRECVRALPLPNASVAETRAEAGAAGSTGSAIARALASLDELCGYAEPWVGATGRLYAMKGPGFEPELAALRPGWAHEATRALFVPGLDAGRMLVVLKRSAGEPRA